MVAAGWHLGIDALIADVPAGKHDRGVKRHFVDGGLTTTERCQPKHKRPRCSAGVSNFENNDMSIHQTARAYKRNRTRIIPRPSRSYEAAERFHHRDLSDRQPLELWAEL